MPKITFSIDLHDHDGDVFQKGIYLHFDDALILPVKDLDALRAMIESLERCEKEIKENY